MFYNVCNDLVERKTINTVAEKQTHYVTLNDFTADQIIAYIHNNKNKFKDNEMYQLLIDDESKDKVIKRLKEVLGKVNSK